MSLLNVESYVFINVFYLVLFCIYVCVDDVIKKKLEAVTRSCSMKSCLCLWKNSGKDMYLI